MLGLYVPKRKWKHGSYYFILYGLVVYLGLLEDVI